MECHFCGEKVPAGHAAELSLKRKVNAGFASQRWQIVSCKVPCCRACYEKLLRQSKKTWHYWLAIAVGVYVFCITILFVAFAVPVLAGCVISILPSFFSFGALVCLTPMPFAPKWHEKVAQNSKIAMLMLQGFQLCLGVKRDISCEESDSVQGEGVPEHKSKDDGVTVNQDGGVRFSKIPPGGAMEMLRVAYEKTRAPQQPVQDGQLAFLNAGKNGIMRLAFQKKQGKVVADHVKCRLYLPDGWNLVPELEAQSAANVIAKFAGPREHEWMSVEHLFLSPDHVNDNLGDWVDIGMKLFGKAILHPAAGKAEGVDGGKYLLFGKLGQRDIHYMKSHQADDMVAYAGTIEIEEKPFRLFIVVLRRGRDSWKFEYVFPAADGVSREALSFRSEEIASAARMFVPIETRGRAVCPLCGAGMDDPPEGKLIDGLTVEMKDFTLFEGGPKVGHAGMTLACCDECKCKLPVSGIDRKVLEGVPDVKAQLDKGASIVEVKCGDRPVTIREACEGPQTEIANEIEEAELWVKLRNEVGRN